MEVAKDDYDSCPYEEFKHTSVRYDGEEENLYQEGPDEDLPPTPWFNVSEGEWEYI
jgi:hypothetical protein